MTKYALNDSSTAQINAASITNRKLHRNVTELTNGFSLKKSNSKQQHYAPSEHNLCLLPTSALTSKYAKIK